MTVRDGPLDGWAWSAAVAEAIGLDGTLLPPILAAGTPAGSWQGVPVHLVGGHDTASAGVVSPRVAFSSSVRSCWKKRSPTRRGAGPMLSSTG